MTRKTPLWRLAAVAGAASLILAACGDDEDPTTETTDPPAETTDDPGTEEPMDFEPVPFALGSLLPQTGQLASIVASLEAGVGMAVDEINAASPGLVTWDAADSGTDPNVASENVDQFLTGDYAAFIGAAASGVSTAIVEKVQEAGVVMCSGSNTAASLGVYDPYYIRTAPSDDLQAPTLGDLIIADGHTSVAVIWRNDEYGVGFGETLAAYLEAGGIEVPLQQGYDPQVTSFSDQLTEVAGSGAQALAAITFEEGGQLVLDLQGVFDGQVYVADGFVDTVGADQLGGDATLLAGIRGTYPSASPATGEATFSDRFAAANPDVPTIFSAHKYDCVITIALAIQVAGSADPTVFVNEINGVTKDGEKCSLFADCLALIEAGTDIDYDGASGQLEFADNGQPSAGTYDLFQYDAAGAQENFDQVETALE